MKKSIIALILAALMLLTACGHTAPSPENAPVQAHEHGRPSPADTIRVSIYPYIPDVPLFESIVRKHWDEIHPEIKLEFVDWDCYIDSTPDNIDVIMYDALFLDSLVNDGYLSPIAEDVVQDAEGILPYAMEGARLDGQLYGIPNLMCSFFLIHFKDDAELAAAENIVDVAAVIDEPKSINGMPKNRERGMLMNFGDNYPYFYLDSIADQDWEPPHGLSSPDLDNPDPEAIQALADLNKLSGAKNETISRLDTWINGEFAVSSKFNEGHGRAYIGYSEDMSFMGDIIDEIDLKAIALADSPNNQLFFSDIVSITTAVTDETKRALCEELLNVMSSERFLTELAFGRGTAQYLLPARSNVYATAAEEHPMYYRLEELVTAEGNHVFRCGTWLNDYLGIAYDVLPKYFKK